MLRAVIPFFALACEAASIGGGRNLELSGPIGPIALPDGDGGVVIVPGEERDGGGGVAEDGGLVVDLFPFASFGTRCEGGALVTYLILSAKGASCAEGRAILESTVPTAPAAYVRLPDETSAGTQSLPGTICAGTECSSGEITLAFDTFEVGTRAAGRYRIQLPDRRAEGALLATWCSFDGAEGGSPLATDVTISEIAMYQAVKISLVEGGQPIPERNAPVIADKEGMIRAFVEPAPGFVSRDLVGRLEIGGQILEEQMRMRAASEEESFESTFDFDVPKELMTTTAEWSIGIYETEGCAPAGAGARHPLQGTMPLEAESSGGAFHLVLVPVRYNADGSGRLPPLDQAQLDLYAERAYAIFPASEVDVTVRAPLDWDNGVYSSGSGWGTLLDGIIDLRSQDDVPDNVYYFGAFVPASSFGNYCGGGCVAGLGMVPGADDAYNRASIGLGFAGRGSTETFTHEVGHSLGRGHAPCGVSGDGAFPYNGARIGVYGWNLVEKELMSPGEFRDMMSYCDPQWISDYNYERIFRRIVYANSSSFTEGGAGDAEAMWRTAIVDADGLRWGRPRRTAQPAGDPMGVTYVRLDGSRRVVEATSIAFDHLPGGFVVMPEPLPLEVAVEIRGSGTLRF